MSIPNLIYLSHPTFGATAAATYGFFTKEYKPPTQPRAIQADQVVNQNGKFKYVYDNGPGFKQWQPFTVACEQVFAKVLGATAGAQYAHLQEMWDYPGVLGLKAPEGVYSVHWSEGSLEPSFRVFPINTSDAQEWAVVVQFEEAS